MSEYNNGFYCQLRTAFKQLVKNNSLSNVEVIVKAAPLKPEDAIGFTKRDDYVLLKGKERLIQAEVLGCKGQAFTSSLGGFNGSLSKVLNLPQDNDFNRAIYIATLNAIICNTGIVCNTVHCRNEGPEKCSENVVDFFQKNYGSPHILMIGYQPALAEALVKNFYLNVLDLDPANVGRIINGVHILDGLKDAEECIETADVIFSTGSIVCNGSIEKYYNVGKPLVLYGTTGAGAAALLNIPRFCPESLSGRT